MRACVWGVGVRSGVWRGVDLKFVPFSHVEVKIGIGTDNRLKESVDVCAAK